MNFAFSDKVGGKILFVHYLYYNERICLPECAITLSDDILATQYAF